MELAITATSTSSGASSGVGTGPTRSDLRTSRSDTPVNMSTSSTRRCAATCSRGTGARSSSCGPAPARTASVNGSIASRPDGLVAHAVEHRPVRGDLLGVEQPGAHLVHIGQLLVRDAGELVVELV